MFKNTLLILTLALLPACCKKKTSEEQPAQKKKKESRKVTKEVTPVDLMAETELVDVPAMPEPAPVTTPEPINFEEETALVESTVPMPEELEEAPVDLDIQELDVEVPAKN